MKVNSTTRLAGLTLVGALALAACGSDNNNAVTAGTSGAPAPSGSAAAAGDVACATGSIMAEGSSAQGNAMDTWIAAYQKACPGATINYQPTGSGAGVASFLGGRVSFAGSDSALKDDERGPADTRCTGGKAIDLPMVTGPIAIAYKLAGVDSLVLDAPTIAKIFSDKIKTWNDPAIAALNPGVKLPATGITAYHRSDESGTTDNFAKYLDAAGAGAWTYGKGKAWTAPGGVGAAKSAGVTQGVTSTDGGVTYVEVSFAENAGLKTAAIKTGTGDAVKLTGESAGKAVEAATVVGTAPDLALKLDYATKAAGAYPIVLVTYEIVCTAGLPAADAALVKSFLTYTISDAGQQAISKVGYAPLPVSIATQVKAAIGALA